MIRRVAFFVALIAMVTVGVFAFYLLSFVSDEFVRAAGGVSILAIVVLVAIALYGWFYGHLAEEEEILARFRVR